MLWAHCELWCLDGLTSFCRVSSTILAVCAERALLPLSVGPRRKVNLWPCIPFCWSMFASMPGPYWPAVDTSAQLFSRLICSLETSAVLCKWGAAFPGLQKGPWDIDKGQSTVDPLGSIACQDIESFCSWTFYISLWYSVPSSALGRLNWFPRPFLACVVVEGILNST